MTRPKSIKIFDVVYKIIYVAKPSDVDIFKRESLWGQIDFWTRTIRIYDTDRADADILQTIWHELLHGICAKLKLDNLNKDEHSIDLLATAINTILMDNVKDFSFK